MLVADNEPGAEIFSGATTLAQALEVFRPAWLMANKNQEFADFYELSLSGTHQNPGPIYCISTGSRFEPTIGNPGDGSSPHCSIVDEYHEHRTSVLYDAMATGMGARSQPMQAVLTTAGVDTGSPCYNKRCQCVQILDGTIQNDNIFTTIYTLDPGDDWPDMSLWQKANPNYGVSVFPDYLEKQRLDALQSSAKQNIIKYKHLNIWCDAGVSFYNMVDWERCAALDVSESDFIGEDCWIGVDLASKIDVAAVIKIFRKDEDFYIFPRFYLPEARTQGEDAAIYAGWAHDGHLLTTPGNMIDQRIIVEDIKADAKKFYIKALCVDPYNALQFIVDMIEFFRDDPKMRPEERKVIEVQQTVLRLSEPMKFSDAKIRDEKLHHDGNPVMTWMMGNVVAKLDRKDNVFPRKEGKNKIDGPVALITALSRAMLVPIEQEQPLPTFF